MAEVHLPLGPPVIGGTAGGPQRRSSPIEGRGRPESRGGPLLFPTCNWGHPWIRTNFSRPSWGILGPLAGGRVPVWPSGGRNSPRPQAEKQASVLQSRVMPCSGLIRERIGGDPTGSLAPRRCDACGARFDANNGYVGGHGEHVRLDGLNQRIDFGSCTCPEQH